MGLKINKSRVCFPSLCFDAKADADGWNKDPDQGAFLWQEQAQEPENTYNIVLFICIVVRNIFPKMCLELNNVDSGKKT